MKMTHFSGYCQRPGSSRKVARVNPVERRQRLAHTPSHTCTVQVTTQNSVAHNLGKLFVLLVEQDILPALRHALARPAAVDEAVQGGVGELLAVSLPRPGTGVALYNSNS